MDKLYSLITTPGSDRRLIAAQASAMADLADRFAQRLSSAKFDQTETMRLMKSISADSESIAEQGERSAEQATMALDSLFIAYTKNEKLANDQQIRAGINALFRQLDDPSAYNGFQFARELMGLSALLP